jgi:hypothetical protein
MLGKASLPALGEGFRDIVDSSVLITLLDAPPGAVEGLRNIVDSGSLLFTLFDTSPGAIEGLADVIDGGAFFSTPNMPTVRYSGILSVRA